MSVPKTGAKVRASDWSSAFPVDDDAWLTYAPAWTAATVNPAIGNGTISGAYMKIGRTVFFRVLITAGTTTTYGTGNYFLSLPVAANAAEAACPIGTLGILDSSAGTRFFRTAWVWTTTTAIFMAEAGTLVTNLAPMTWATSDQMFLHGMYEAAA